jgi:hypothetical protein
VGTSPRCVLLKNVSSADIFMIACLLWRHVRVEDLLLRISPLNTFPGEVPSTACVPSNVIITFRNLTLCFTLQPASLSRTGDGNRPMLVIVQNPGVSDFAFTDNFSNEVPIPNASVFKLPVPFQQSQWPDPSSSSVTEHEGLQLRLRTSGELSTTESHWDQDIDSQVGNYNAGGYMEEVAVDVKGPLTSFTFLPFENPCCESRPLHSRSNSSKSLQANSVH